jgi:tyrosine-protein phosphatase SIW14
MLGPKCLKHLFVVVGVLKRDFAFFGMRASNFLRGFPVRHTGGGIRALVFATVLCAAPLGTPAQQSASAASPPAHDIVHPIAQHKAVPGVPNFGKVTPTLYRGAQPTKKGLKSLSQLGVDIVVDLRDSSQGKQEEKEVRALGMKFIGIPWRCTDPKDDYFAKFLTLLRDNPDKKIFVHCHAGVDRTGMMIASYRMAEQGWTAAEALREMQAFGFSLFHQTICYGLGAYEQRFPSVVSSSPALQNLRVAQQKPTSPLPPKQ